MLLSGSLAPALRTGALVGMIELREAQSAPRQRQPSAVRERRGVGKRGRESRGSRDQPNLAHERPQTRRAPGRRVGYIVISV